MTGLSNDDLQRQVLLQQLGKKTNHILHFFISLFTGLLWVPFWILITISNRLETAKLRSIAETGKPGSAHYVKLVFAGVFAFVVLFPILSVWIFIFSK